MPFGIVHVSACPLQLTARTGGSIVNVLEDVVVVGAVVVVVGAVAVVVGAVVVVVGAVVVVVGAVAVVVGAVVVVVGAVAVVVGAVVVVVGAVAVVVGAVVVVVGAVAVVVGAVVVVVGAKTATPVGVDWVTLFVTGLKPEVDFEPDVNDPNGEDLRDPETVLVEDLVVVSVVAVLSILEPNWLDFRLKRLNSALRVIGSLAFTVVLAGAAHKSWSCITFNNKSSDFFLVIAAGGRSE
jgi:hypothetical protein